MQGRTSYFCHSTPRGRLKWAGFLSEQEEKRFNQYYHPGEGRNNRGGDQYGGDIFFNEGDNCVVSYEEEPKEGLSNARIHSDATEGQEMPSHKRLLVVANRLPVSVIRKDDESWQLEINVGGLVSALLGLKDFEVKWIGWAGVIVPDEAGQQSLTKALAEKKCIPVFLNEETVNQYYNGYCNNILWPLLHYLGLPQDDRLATGHGYQSQFDAYKKANQMFADVVYKNYKDGDIVWCHDYHLMLLPQCLKQYNSKVKIGWFLHTPFPSSEIQQILPSRSELLRSVLAADIVGFHTFDYVRHFVTSCTRILGLEGTPEGVEHQGKLTRISAFPIGIDSDRFIRALELPRVQDYMKELRDRFAGRKVMLGVDRLDKIKGIPQKILAFEKFLEENPEWRDKVVLLQIAVPTRTDIPECQKLTRQVHEMVGRVNGKFGSLTAVPIHHLDQSLGFHALCALYAVADVALVTSLRDGMNLVSYEFVACQDSKKGVLILSEFAGAAQSLGAGAILINPWNISEVASSIAYALNMPSEEREKRHQLNFTHVTSQSAHKWAETFVSELNGTEIEAQRRTTQVRPSLPSNVAIENYLKSDNRLLILGFNATLTQSVETPYRRGDQIRDMELNLHPGLCEPLRKITDDAKTSVVVLSGSKRNVLDDNFGSYNLWLAAENGMFLRHTKGEWITIMPELLNMEWVDRLKLVFEYFTERTPRSSFELRETSLLWNYKYADVDFGRLQARILLEYLRTGRISNTAVDVFQGARSIEVRPVGVTKGVAIDRILGEIVHNEGMNSPITYVLCTGHLLEKDEDLYSFFEPEYPDELDAVRVAVPSIRTAETMRGSSILDLKGENYFSCAVGRKRSTARYLLGSSEDVVMLLKGLARSLMI